MYSYSDLVCDMKKMLRMVRMYSLTFCEDSGEAGEVGPVLSLDIVGLLSRDIHQILN
jgi:hypothetical protein